MQKNEYAVAVDCGKTNTKVVVTDCEGKVIARDIFPTKISDDISQNDNTLVKSKTFRYGGRSFSVDDENIVCETSTLNTKNDDIHKVCTMYGIAKNVPNNSVVHVTIGCPLTVFGRGINEKNTYRDNLLPKGRIDCDIIDHGNAEHKYFEISGRMVIPESMGILFTNSELSAKNIALIDIGGLNVNASIVKKGAVVPSSCVTLKGGSKSLFNTLRQKYNEILEPEDIQFTNNNDIPLFIKKGGVTNYLNQTREPTCRIVGEHIKSIIGELKSHEGWESIKTLDTLVFVGGTSELLKSYIKSLGDNVEVVENAIFANAEGFCKSMYDAINKQAVR